MVSLIEDQEERAKFVRENTAILKKVVSDSFKPDSRHSAESIDYLKITKDMQDKYGVDGTQISEIVLTEFVSAVKEMCKINNLSLTEKYRRRRWVLTQGKRWGMDTTVLTYGMNKHGGDAWLSTPTK